VQATIYNLAGEEVEKIDLDDAIFGVTPNHAVIQQAVLRQQANARQGTHDTKTRADVRGGGKKPWRQKGTGRARQGSTRSPQWRHGGIVFGPHPRSYEQDMPRKMRRLAIRGVLSGKLADGELMIVDSFETLEPRTKAMTGALTNLNLADKKTLIFTTGEETTLKMAAGNLPNVKMLSAHLLSIVDMLKHDVVVIPRAALDVVTGILGNTGGRRKLTLRGVAAPAIPAAAPKSTGKKAAPAKAEAKAEVAEVAEVAEKPARKPARAAASAETKAEAAPATETAEAEVKAESKPARKSPAKAEAKAETKSEAKAEAKSEAKPARKPTIAKGSIKIGNVHYEGDEHVEVQNTNDFPVDITGYVLRDKNDADQAFTFPEGAELNPGGHVTVFTAPGHRYTFDSKRPIWNDKGDEIELLDASGKVVATYAYGSYAPDADDKKSEG
jgi:large subunit ribosomal protein L4